ncbi:MAG: hypothetical protein ACTTJ3_07645 [Treponema sp.]
MKLDKEKLQRLLHSKALTQESLSLKLKNELNLKSTPNISRIFSSNNDTPEEYLKVIADVLDVGIEDIIIDNNPIMNSISVLGGVVSAVGIAALIGIAIASGILSKKDKTDLINILKDD